MMKVVGRQVYWFVFATFLTYGCYQDLVLTQVPEFNQLETTLLVAVVDASVEEMQNFGHSQNLSISLEQSGMKGNRNIFSVEGEAVTSDPDNVTSQLKSSFGNRFWTADATKKLATIPSRMDAENWFNDPMWNVSWNLNPVLFLGRDQGIYRAWQRGYTGENVTVGLVDAGIFQDAETIPNLRNDMSVVPDDAVEPPFDFRDHGTLMATLIAGVANNSICGVGIAYKASLVDIRSNLETQETMIFETDQGFKPVDIYNYGKNVKSAGEFVLGPKHVILDERLSIPPLFQQARNGLGSIFVFAAGNSGRLMDSCAASRYCNYLFTITVGAVASTNEVMDYSTPCAAVMTCSYVATEPVGGDSQTKLVAQSLFSECTQKPHGTSSACANVAGIIALTLQANPNLCWRSVQYLIVKSSEALSLRSKQGWNRGESWRENGAGKMFHEYFGFGLLNAEKMVLNAERWRNAKLPKQRRCSIHKFTVATADTGEAKHYSGSETFHVQKEAFLVFNSKACDQESPAVFEANQSAISSVEHVVLRTTFGKGESYRGDIAIFITSPMKTESRILRYRWKDYRSTLGYMNWAFKTVHFWGEDSKGDWIVQFKIDLRSLKSSTIIHNISLDLYGIGHRQGEWNDLM